MPIEGSRTTIFFDDLVIGQRAELIRTVREADVLAFAEVSGDDNPVHLDEDFAASTPFKTRIAHGMLTASYLSTLLGTQLPGPGTVYLSQTLVFKRPVTLGAEVMVRAEVTGLDPAKGRVTLACVAEVAGKSVLEGEAVVIAPRRPQP